MRIGIDLGGTKTEVIALDDAGEQRFRHRLPTPREDYQQTIETIAALVDMAEQATGQTGSVGIGIPGSLSPYTGVVKNANSTWLNGQPFDNDVSRRLKREVRLANDANCLAVSEAVDGAAAVTFPGRIIFDKTMAPTPKKAPCGKPETSLPMASIRYEEEKVNMALPVTHSMTRNSSTCLSEKRLEKSAIMGAPSTTPKA